VNEVVKMIVKIIIRRTVGEEKVKELIPLLEEIRTLAKERPDYISGETLKSLDKPDEFLVISTWNSPVSWEKWLANKERQEIQKRIDSLLGGKTEYEMFYYVSAE
jgi:heme-degrading monooxygenase HmoA